MISITAETRRARVTETELLTSGSAGIQCQFTFTEDWDGLNRIAVFRQGDDGNKVDVILDETNACIVPWETLLEEGEVLFIGVYGSNAQGVVIIPTVWASAGVVKQGVEPNTPSQATPTPDIWTQILDIAEEAKDTADDAMSIAEQAESDVSTAIEDCSQYATTASNAADAAVAAQGHAETAQLAAETAEASAEANALKSEGFALGKQNGDDVDSTSPYYHNNSKYFSQQSSTSATVAVNAQEAAEEAEAAIENMTVTATAKPEGASPTVTKTMDPQTGYFNLDFGIPKGDSCVNHVLEANVSGIVFDPNAEAGSQLAPSSVTVNLYEIRGDTKTAYAQASRFNYSIYCESAMWGTMVGKTTPTSTDTLTLPTNIEYSAGIFTAISYNSSNQKIAEVSVPIIACGEDGAGVPAGGTTGQVLKKKSNTDYDTEWANESGGGGTSDYTDLTNKPQINSVTLTGNKSLSELGAASQSDLEDLEGITGDGQLSGFTATDLTGAANELKNTLNSKADQDDLASLNLTGTTNTTGNQIDAGTYFYLNGALVKAKTDIANGATFTDGTNYEAVTAGGLNAMSSHDWHFLTTTSTKYELPNTIFQTNAYIIRSGFCFLTLSVNVISPSSTSEIICNVPAPVGITTLGIPLASDFSYGNASPRFLIQNGILYARGGTANYAVSTSICYPCDL